MFAVFRHPDVTVAGVLPEEAAEFQRHQGWYRVSDWVDLPAQVDPAVFGADLPDLDAPEPEADDEINDEDADTPKPKTARKRAAAEKTEE